MRQLIEDMGRRRKYLRIASVFLLILVVPTLLAEESRFSAFPSVRLGQVDTGVSVQESSVPDAFDEQGEDVSVSVSEDVTDSAQMEAAVESDRIQEGDTLFISFEAPEDDPSAVAKANLILGEKLYGVEDTGVIRLPVIGTMPVAGLSSADVANLLSSEAALTGVSIEVRRLALTPSTTSVLVPYGRDLFGPGSSVFNQPTNVPVPDDYVVGPGDTVEVLLYGKVNEQYALEIKDDGFLSIPDFGPISVSGLTFSELSKLVKDLVKEKMLQVQAHVAMGALRSMTVFLFGEVAAPGPKTVTALSTVMSALAAGGGITENGSLRFVELKRQGKTVASLDLYDMLLKGSLKDNMFLKPNDVVFVPTVGPRVSVLGEVRRPGIYELRAESTLGEVLHLAGGVLPTAMISQVQVERIQRGKERRLFDVNLNRGDALAFPVRDGDTVMVQRVPPRVQGTIELSGQFKTPGTYQWTSKTNLGSLISWMGGLPNDVDLDYVLVVRQTGPKALLKPFSVRLTGNGKNSQVKLEPNDEVIAFQYGDTTDRAVLLEPLLDRLQKQGTADRPARIVSVEGEVRAPGKYPLEPGMRVGDLLRAAGGLRESAYQSAADLSRLVSSGDSGSDTSHLSVSLSRALSGDSSANLKLRSYDVLSVRKSPSWQEERYVEVAGEVKFPGVYPISRGDKLSDLIERAGGLTSLAFGKGAVFLREDLREKEQAELERLSARLEAQIGAMSESKLRNPEMEAAVTVGNQLLADIRATEPLGRLVIDLPAVINRDTEVRKPSDLLLQDGDKLYVPPQADEVTVMGQVLHATSHRWQSGLDREDYIDLSGGTNRMADGKRVYVIKASGATNTVSTIARVNFGENLFLDPDFSGSYVTRFESTAIQPGDTIVVPMDMDHVRPLSLYSTISRMFFDIAVGVSQLNRSF